VHVDFGTGDGAFVRRFAKLQPDVLVIGVDANGEGLRDAFRRAGLKPARGGTPNALFGRLSLEQAPGELVGLADALTVFFPWGSLLRAVALPEAEALARLRGLGKPAARVEIAFGYDPQAEPGAVAELGLPSAPSPEALVRGYRAAGFSVSVRALDREALRSLPTTWAGKLAFSQRDRRFVQVTGQLDT
jgi:16S rRNA (adenine(1408)-N(1))-methyltransferase